MQHVMFNGIREIAEYSAERITGPNVAVSGGSTYKEVFSFWAENTGLSQVNYFPVDERLVPFEDIDCNWRMTLEILLEPLGISQQKNNWASSSKDYLELLSTQSEFPPVFDQLFLGMGDDGHTASLFPGGPELMDQKSVVLETDSPKGPRKRISLGLSVLWHCRDLILIVTGKKKSRMLKRLFQNDTSLPVSIALGGHKNPLVLMDKDAGSDL